MPIYRSFEEPPEYSTVQAYNNWSRWVKSSCISQHNYGKIDTRHFTKCGTIQSTLHVSESQ